jgi:hypothetical protein
MVGTMKAGESFQTKFGLNERKIEKHKFSRVRVQIAE